jgi:ornithine cyclodeaminase/alanine dehydrogenase-like protein (mu-crystallin family)
VRLYRPDAIVGSEVRRLISSEAALSIARDTLVDQSGGHSGLACDYAAAFRRGIRSDGQRTIALIQGMAIGDVALASHVLRAWKASA